MMIVMSHRIDPLGVRTADRQHKMVMIMRIQVRNLHTRTTEITMSDNREFNIRRVARPGSSISVAPTVVECEWTEMNIDNVYIYRCRGEDLTTIARCVMHGRQCRGHHMIDQNESVYMIPFGFATGDDLRYSDAAATNMAAFSGDISADEMANYCLDKIRGNRGVLRRMCNSTRPTNSMRCVESPKRPNINDDMTDQMGCITIPTEFFDRSMFLRMSEDGRFESIKMEEGDIVMYGRCPSTGKESAFLTHESGTWCAW